MTENTIIIDIEKLKRDIVERLKPLDPEKIILFGSYAGGKPTAKYGLKDAREFYEFAKDVYNKVSEKVN